REAGDGLFEARARTARALVHLARGAAHRAESDLARADHLYAATSQTVEVAFTWHNRGIVAYRSGDLPAALSCLDEAGQRYRRLAVPLLELAIDRCDVLLAAGLPGDALAEADAALRGDGRGGGRAARRAALLLAGARAALATGEPGLAAARAQAALRLFTGQHRPWWRTHAGLLLLQARCASRPPSARLLRQAARVAADLDLLGSSEAVQARLLAGGPARAPRPAAEAGAPPGAPAPNPGPGGGTRGPAPRAGSPKRCAPTPPVTGAGCSPPAGAASPSSMSISSPSAPRNCGPRRPRTAPSSRRSRSGPRWPPPGPGCCSPGASDGGRRRTRSPRPGRPTTPDCKRT